MPTIKFTARTANRLTATPGKRVEYYDETVPGFALRVTERGAKSWVLFYRHRGRHKRLTMGRADGKAGMGLADARDAAKEALAAVRKGIDPVTQKQDAKRAKTVGDLATSYLELWAMGKKRSWKNDRNMLNQKVLPKWKHRAVADIRRRDVLNLVDAIAAGGAPIYANRIAALLSKLFAFAVQREIVELSPAVRIPKPGVERARDRVLTEDEVRTFWRHCEALPDRRMAAFYELRLLTAQRGKEVNTMRWADIDIKGAWWTIPSEAAKNKLAHRVPLVGAAARLIAELLQTARAEAIYVLEEARGVRQQREAAATFGMSDFRGHDLRRTAASMMASGGVSRLVISKVLNHIDRGVTAIYDRHGYDPEKQAALTWWDGQLARILDDSTAPGEVLPFQRRA